MQKSLDGSGVLLYNEYSVIYGIRMINTRFVVSFLLFYTTIDFISSDLCTGLSKSPVIFYQKAAPSEEEAAFTLYRQFLDHLDHILQHIQCIYRLDDLVQVNIDIDPCLIGQFTAGNVHQVLVQRDHIR